MHCDIFGVCFMQMFFLLGKLKSVKVEAEVVQRVLSTEQILLLQTILHCHSSFNAKVQGIL